MTGTPLKALCLLERLNDDGDSSSEHSVDTDDEVHDDKTPTEAPIDALPLTLDGQCFRREASVIYISSGEESSDLEDEAEEENQVGLACEDDASAAGTIASDLPSNNDNYNNNIDSLPDSKPSRHATQCLPVELDGIFTAAIETLQDEDNGTFLNGYEALALVEQQEERDRQSTCAKASSLSEHHPAAHARDFICHTFTHTVTDTLCESSTQPTRGLRRVDLALDEPGRVSDQGTDAIIEVRTASMDAVVDCRSLERSELEKSKAALMNTTIPRVNGKDVSQGELSYTWQKPWAQLEESRKDRTLMAQFQESMTGTGVLEAGKAAQVRRGAQRVDKVKTGRIPKLVENRSSGLTQRPKLSERQQLLNSRSRLAAAEEVREQRPQAHATGLTGKTKRARRNKQIRRNKVKQKRAVASRA